jgi:hypothetical protein
MYIIFENFRNYDTYLWQRIMAMGAKGEWTHCELIFDEMNNVRASAWGSSGMEFRKWEFPKKPQYFELYPLPSQNWKQAYEFCKEHEGLEYDKVGVLGMMYNWAKLNSPRKVFCSELCFKVTDNYTDVPLPNIQPSLVSPVMMRRYLIKQGIKPVPLSVLTK